MFKQIKKQVLDQFNEMVASGETLLITDTDKNALWDAYLAGFDDEAERQHHNCNCCRQFIKNYGKIVVISGVNLVTVWDFIAEDTTFERSIFNMRDMVRNSNVQDRFLNDFTSLGTDSNYDIDNACTWEHFHVTAPKEIKVPKKDKDSLLSAFRTNKQVFKRALDEITINSVETVLELIAQDSLYRGKESERLLESFLKTQQAYALITGEKERDLFCWQLSTKAPVSVQQIRNSAIGTLLVDLSEKRELDQAVASFEQKVAPANYKRPTALVTKGMIDEAQKTIEDMGLAESLGRRFAVPEDISVDNILFVNRDAKPAANVFEEMKEDAQVSPQSFSKVEEIHIDKFLSEVLPSAKGIEVLVENGHLSNLVSVIAPVAPEAPGLFKWNNPFSWSYVNNLTDSIKEKVKAAGGRVDCELRVSLSWFNYDDLDLHVHQPRGSRIGFDTYRKPAISAESGQLDVDMNAGTGQTREGVENITWTNKNQMLEGVYRVEVDNYSKREAGNIGCIVEVECNGEIFTFEHAKDLKKNTPICEFSYSKKDGVKFTNGQTSSVISKEKWGINTNKFQKVSMIMNSPNFWKEEVGNKHVFFVIEGAKNDETPRGFFNEFLKEDLTKNRKVFEVLGGKLKVEPSDRQITGVGFSTTQRNSIICRVEGNFKRTLKVLF